MGQAIGPGLSPNEGLFPSAFGRVRIIAGDGGPFWELLHDKIDPVDEFEEAVRLAQNCADFQRRVDLLPVAVYAIDGEGTLTYFNPAAEKFARWHPIIGEQKWCVSWRLRLLDGTPIRHDECPMAIAVKERRVIRGLKAIAEAPDGSQTVFQPFPTPMLDKNGLVTGAVNMLLPVAA